ncbi:MAG: beta-galactosidase [Clostridia bacterium]|nr:beta-galactosidase [Clostridia bacterium]
MKVEIKNRRFLLDGKEDFLVSGEFHYFRVPAADWEKRMTLFKEMGGNCIATYVPWCVHEMTEGDIVFGDEPQRDLAAFLELCKKFDLPVIVRPGPYCYSELDGSGVPKWVNEKYPEVLARRINGEAFGSVSYMHPLFFEKAEKYLKAFAKVVRPYLDCNGGPVFSVQLDNEITGTHVWAGTLDYNPQTWGFGKEDGEYAKYLISRYGAIENVNRAYNTSWKSFSEAYPLQRDAKNVYACRSGKDMFDFYLDMCGRYLEKIADCLYGEGVKTLFCHNSGNWNMTGYFEKMLPRFEKYGGLFLGCDHYYNLGQNFENNNPTPYYAMDILRSNDQLLSLGMPQTTLELPGGSLSAFPPILAEDVEACYMINTAMGMKGLNYYIYTGGPNYKNTGNSGDIYDFNALVRADGSINRTYYAAKRFGEFLHSHKFLQSAERHVTVRIACDQEYYRSSQYCYESDNSQADAKTFMKKGVLYSLLASEYAPGLFDIAHGVPDTDMPLVLCGSDSLSQSSQENIVSFVKNGGKLLVFRALPTLDENYAPCAVLNDFIGIKTEKYTPSSPAECKGMDERVYMLDIKYAVCPENGDEILVTAKKPVAIRRKIGKGEVIFCGFDYVLSQFSQVDMLRKLISSLGAKAAVYHSNPHVFTSLLESKSGEKTLFLMNLYSSPQTTDFTFDGKTFSSVPLAAMEVKTYDF